MKKESHSLTKRRYWRRSSRWRAAFKRVKPETRNYWRLWALGANYNPFGLRGEGKIAYIMAQESSRMSGLITEMILQPSPWLAVMKRGRFPETV